MKNIKELFRSGVNFFKENELKITPAFHLAGKCIGEVATVTQLVTEPSIYSYVNCAVKCKEHYNELFKKEPQDYFLNSEWKSVFSSEVYPVIIQILEKTRSNKIRSIKKIGQNDKVTICDISDKLKIGWSSWGSATEAMYVSSGHIEDVMEFLRKSAWGMFDSNCISLGTIKVSWNTYFTLDGQPDHLKFIPSGMATKYIEGIKKYSDRGLGRSILFYGPPGTGKSNLVKNISNSMGLKTIRLQNLNDIRNQAIVHILNVFDPDALIIEDIDHLYKNDISTLLEKIEGFNIRNKYVLATANEIGKLNDALLRPGRFDELIEIKQIDYEYIKSLINNDNDIFEIIKDYPVAFIMEVVKRVETIGKEETLKSMNDIQTRVKICDKKEYKLDTPAAE